MCFFIISTEGYIYIYMKYKEVINNDLEFSNDMVVIDYKEETPRLDRQKRFNKRLCSEAGTNYTPEYWRKSNAIPLTATEENIIKSLR